MGVSYFLHRVSRPIDLEGEEEANVHELSKGLDFGSLENLKRRLFEAKVYGVDPLDPLAEGHITSMDEGFWGEMEGPAINPFTGEEMVNPFTGEALKMPSSFSMDIESDQGSRIPLNFWGNPVTHITFDRVHPRDILTITDALPDLAPFAIWCDADGVLENPEKYRKKPPAKKQSHSLTPIPPVNTPLASQERIRWSFQATGSFSKHNAQYIENILYVASWQSLTALEVETQEVIWDRRFSSGPIFSLPFKYILIAGCEDGIYGLDLKTGECLWEYEPHGRVTSCPVRISENECAFGTEGGVITALHVRNGEPVWSLDWVPGPVYTPIAFNGDRVCFTSHDDHLGHIYAFKHPPDGSMPALHTIEGYMFNEMTFAIPSMLYVEAVSNFVFVLSDRHLLRLTFPDLEDERVVEEYQWDTGFERFIIKLNDQTLAYALSSDDSRGILRVIDVETLNLKYELPLEYTPSDPVVIDDHRFAFILTPFREDEESEGRLLVLEIETGEVLQDLPLGFKGWRSTQVSTDGKGVFTHLSHLSTPSDQSLDILTYWDID